jgi:hypothetical protein
VPKGKKGHGGAKSKRLLKKVMRHLYQKHCLQRNPYIVKFKVIFNVCNIGRTYIIEFYFIFSMVLICFLFEELVELELKKL